MVWYLDDVVDRERVPGPGSGGGLGHDLGTKAGEEDRKLRLHAGHGLKRYAEAELPA